MGQAVTTLPRRGFGETSRTDLWWLKPLLVFLGLSAFIVYSTWAALQNAHFEYEGYLSPMYSPLFFSPEGVDSHHALFEALPGWWPAWLPLFPAFLILWAPGGFRFTCYYYRGAYYKSFWGSPVSCTVGKAQKGYRGEKLFPLVFQNLHRFFLYFALIFLLVLSYDVYRGMFFSDGAGGTEFGIGVGTLVLTLNVILLGGYTFGCHSLRHLVGGRLNILSKKPSRLKAWKGVTWCNVRHQLFAWLSLFWVGFTDFYVRMCSMGVWTDLRIF